MQHRISRSFGLGQLGWHGRLLMILGAFLGGQVSSRSEDSTTSASAIQRLTADLEYLAADELAGRDVGSPGIDLAARLVADRFAELGLQTELFEESPFQRFTIPGAPSLGPAEQNALRFSGTSAPLELTLSHDFIPLSLGTSGQFAGEVVFAGYGITAPDLSYDDYAGLDVTGKVVIVLRKEPNQSDPQSKFDGERPSQHAFFSTKELNAAMHRAASLIIVNDRATASAETGDQLPDTTGGGAAISDQRIPTFFCRRQLVDQLLKASGRSLDELEAAIDRDVVPHSLKLDGVTCEGQASIVQTQTAVHNVVGLLPGIGSLAEEFVVIGAHYDHVGMGGVGSLAPGTIEIHNGADDNASGTATLLEVARRLSVDDSTSRRSIVFVAFTAEERGLLGSRHYVRNPRWPLERTVAMLNLDMVGRLRDNTLTVFGTGTAAEFDSMVDRIGQSSALVIDKQPAGFGPSDHQSFYEVDIPVFHFFTGLHNDYHRPSDDVDKANVAGMVQIADMVSAVLREVSSMPQRPTLVKNSAVAQIGRTQRGGRPTLGVRLARSTTDGVTVEEVLDNSVASRAGIQAGDVILTVADQSIDTVEQLQSLLQEQKSQESTAIEVRRGVQQLRLTAKWKEK